MKQVLLENVDVLETMEEIVNLNMLSFKSDFAYDVQMMEESIQDKGVGGSFVWTCGQSSTFLSDERNLLIDRNASAETFKVKNESDPHTLSFLVETKALEDGSIVGNLLALDYKQFLENTQKEKPSPINVLLHFQKQDKPMEFPFEEYDMDMKGIYLKYGALERVEFLVEDEPKLQKTLQSANDLAYGSGISVTKEAFLSELATQKAEDYKHYPSYFEGLQEESLFMNETER